jgi:hypothetical protein
MIELLIFNSFLIWGVYASIQEGMIFGKVGDWVRGYRQMPGYFTYNLPDWIKKPLATCPICMASVYGTPIFWLAYIAELINYDYIIIFYICYVFALSGVQYLILTFIPE